MFECTECAEAVRCELTFAAAVRSAMVTPAPADAPMPLVPALEPGFWDRLRAGWHLQPGMAFAYILSLALAAVCVFFAIGRRPAIQPQFAETFFAPGLVHGEEHSNVHDLPAGSPFYGVHFPLSANVHTYVYEMLASGGRRESTASVAAPASQSDQMSLFVPLAGLSSGVYALQVHAGSLSGEVVSRSEFRIIPK
jgi:hypothetical protein